MIEKLCQKHSKWLTQRSAVKIFRFAKKCGACLNGVKEKPPRLCSKHDALYNEWQEKMLSKIKCEDCR